jgi:hypothetical protein
VTNTFGGFDWRHVEVMKIITNIPPDVLRGVVVDWLRLENISRLDSAVCCHDLRGPFLQQLYEHTHRYYRYKNYSDGLMNWTMTKLPPECQVYFLRIVIKSLRKTIASKTIANNAVNTQTYEADPLDGGYDWYDFGLVRFDDY